MERNIYIFKYLLHPAGEYFTWLCSTSLHLRNKMDSKLLVLLMIFGLLSSALGEFPLKKITFLSLKNSRPGRIIASMVKFASDENFLT